MFRFPQHDTAVYEMGSSHSCTSSVVRLLFASLEQDALNKLRNDRSDRHLHVPLLSGDPGMHRHVLHRELNLDGQTPKLHHLAKPSPTGTVQTSSDGAFQSARILPEYPMLQPSPKKIDAMGCRFIWFVSRRKCCPPMDHHCWGNTPMKYSFVR